MIENLKFLVKNDSNKLSMELKDFQNLISTKLKPNIVSKIEKLIPTLKYVYYNQTYSDVTPLKKPVGHRHHQHGGGLSPDSAVPKRQRRILDLSPKGHSDKGPEVREPGQQVPVSSPPVPNAPVPAPYNPDHIVSPMDDIASSSPNSASQSQVPVQSHPNTNDLPGLSQGPLPPAHIPESNAQPVSPIHDEVKQQGQQLPVISPPIANQPLPASYNPDHIVSPVDDDSASSSPNQVPVQSQPPTNNIPGSSQGPPPPPAPIPESSAQLVSHVHDEGKQPAQQMPVGSTPTTIAPVPASYNPDHIVSPMDDGASSSPNQVPVQSQPPPAPIPESKALPISPMHDEVKQPAQQVPVSSPPTPIAPVPAAYNPDHIVSPFADDGASSSPNAASQNQVPVPSQPATNNIAVPGLQPGPHEPAHPPNMPAAESGNNIPGSNQPPAQHKTPEDFIVSPMDDNVPSSPPKSTSQNQTPVQSSEPVTSPTTPNAPAPAAYNPDHIVSPVDDGASSSPNSASQNQVPVQSQPAVNNIPGSSQNPHTPAAISTSAQPVGPAHDEAKQPAQQVPVNSPPTSIAPVPAPYNPDHIVSPMDDSASSSSNQIPVQSQPATNNIPGSSQGPPPPPTPIPESSTQPVSPINNGVVSPNNQAQNQVPVPANEPGANNILASSQPPSPGPQESAVPQSPVNEPVPPPSPQPIVPESAPGANTNPAPGQLSPSPVPIVSTPVPQAIPQAQPQSLSAPVPQPQQQPVPPPAPQSIPQPMPQSVQPSQPPAQPEECPNLDSLAQQDIDLPRVCPLFHSNDFQY